MLVPNAEDLVCMSAGLVWFSMSSAFPICLDLLLEPRIMLLD